MPGSAYANFACAKARGKDITSSQFNFGPDELAYIADHFIYLDHVMKSATALALAWARRSSVPGVVFSAGISKNF